jgi:hypothetical protein
LSNIKLFLPVEAEISVTANMKNPKSSGKPGKGRHGTRHHAKAVYQIISASSSWDICYKNFHYDKYEKKF